jgi:thiamine kinase-like enzyme
MRIVVVANPATHIQVQMALERAGHYNIKVVSQNVSRGPVDAILVGLHALGVERHMHDTYILMSDTFIEEKLAQYSGTWIGEARTPVGHRSFCVRKNDGTYVDKQVHMADFVTIGAYHFVDTVELMSEASLVVASATANDENEVGMGPLLSCFTAAKTIEFSTWLDIGDVHALATARRTRFIARSEHTLSLDNAGILTKKGTSEQFFAQRSWLLEQSTKPAKSANLVPRIYNVIDDGYEMEYIDLPTLSELWLYWPGRPDTWAQILQSVVDRLELDLWWSGKSRPEVADRASVATWFTGKALERLTKFEHGLAAQHFDLLERASEVFGTSSMVRAHGDLNFNNILYSINTGTFKLIDPRGNATMPLIYELAKLRYSYHAGFSAITHGLFDYETGALLPDRTKETAAMDSFLDGYISLDQLQVAEGCLLLAGAPLHSYFEREAMIIRGVQLIKEIVG